MIYHLHAKLNMANSSLRTNSAMEMTDDQQMPVSSKVWLAHYSVNGNIYCMANNIILRITDSVCVCPAASGLSIYSMLAPNAYPQLKTQVVHSPDTHAVIPSVVYNVSSVYFLPETV